MGDAEREETLKVYQMLAELITIPLTRLTIESATQGESDAKKLGGGFALPGSI